MAGLLPLAKDFPLEADELVAGGVLTAAPFDDVLTFVGDVLVEGAVGEVLAEDVLDDLSLPALVRRLRS